MHHLVRDLYKRAVLVGRDYPHPEGMEYVRRTWKAALRNPENCPSCYNDATGVDTEQQQRQCEKEIRKAVGRGRHMVKEMMGVIQLKKYRAMRRRYGEGLDLEEERRRIQDAVLDLERKTATSFDDGMDKSR